MIRPACLLVSLGLHAVIFFWLSSTEPRAVPEKIEVEINERKSSPKPKRLHQAHKAIGKNKSAKSSAGLGAFIPKGDSLFKPPGKEYYDKVYAEAKGSSEWPEDDWGSHGNDFAQFSEHAGHLDQLREEIENMLYYPGVLARRGIQGAINARLTFDEGSICAFKKTRVEGAEPYLRVYILALINKVRTLSVVQRMGFRAGQKVDLSFNFYVSENPISREMDETQSRVAGNVVTFQRGTMKSSLEWELGPIRGTWFAPVVFLDIPWIVENWEKYVDKKDPLRDFR